VSAFDPRRVEECARSSGASRAIQHCSLAY